MKHNIIDVATGVVLGIGLAFGIAFLMGANGFDWHGWKRQKDSLDARQSRAISELQRSISKVRSENAPSLVPSASDADWEAYQREYGIQEGRARTYQSQ